ncbi:hypothetical protein IQ264_25390 [Phormidium sp. LEGE 05292]|uniref:hypothetical protein n=1 Tax=[Phormidium] sp. LEGE 05292 TaxID=767427 RepID=UPI00187FDB18|nr:hypothetical protein [Phormidium sp. LEGE 05292]MBE9228749.1 hypothetical protein [Phormidium sp. LEGE 05292]
MKLNIYRFGLASSFSLCCLLAPKTVAAKEFFLSQQNFDYEYQQMTVNSVMEITETLEINFTNDATYIGKTINNPKHKVAITNSKNAEFQSSESQVRTGLEAKGGKKPPRKG